MLFAASPRGPRRPEGGPLSSGWLVEAGPGRVVAVDPVELHAELPDLPGLPGRRLRLRPPALGDVPRITEACQDPETRRWTTIPVPYSTADAAWFVQEYAGPGWALGHLPVFAVTDADSGDYLGSVDLRLDEAGAGEVGFVVAPWARGCSVGATALRLLCRWGFADLGLARIEWQAYVGNEGSRRVAEKVGFTVEGLCRSRLVQRGVRRDGWIGGLLPGELRG